MEIKIDGKKFTVGEDEYTEILRQIGRFKNYLTKNQMAFCEWRKRFGHEKDSDLKTFLNRNKYALLAKEVGFGLLLAEINPCPMGH
ncbi:MAG: hypothetical protein V3574_01660 [Candidatus Moraniibacteriota bacterium]